MSDPRTFISFDFDHDEDQRVLFVGQSKNSKTPFSIEDWSSKDKLPENQWESKIEDKISRCNLMIVLSGRFMASASGIRKEIAMAKKHNVPFFGVYVDNANTSSNLPTGLARNRTISWKWDPIAKAISQMMGEGKNK